MIQIHLNTPPNRQQQYRKSQKNKGVVRFELQVSAESKAQFDETVAAIANELETPWDPRRRLAQARMLAFDEITRGITHEFFTLKEQIDMLTAEIKALSPTFFKSKMPDNTPLPKAIDTLPDDPHQLKQLLAQTYLEAQQAKKAALHHQRSAKQYQELYETSADYNEQLKRQLDSQEGFSETI